MCTYQFQPSFSIFLRNFLSFLHFQVFFAGWYKPFLWNHLTRHFLLLTLLPPPEFAELSHHRKPYLAWKNLQLLTNIKQYKINHYTYLVK